MASGQLQNQTFDNTDSRLKYQGGWFVQGKWDAPAVGQAGTLSSTNDPTATVTFTFPEPAVAFFYYGMQRSNGGLYGICVDCDPNNPNWVQIDALNPADDGQNPPVLLFSQTFNPPAVHEIIIRNEDDARGRPSGNSQITVDRFVLQVQNPDAPSPSPAPLSPSAGGVPFSSQVSSTSTSLSASASVSSVTESIASTASLSVTTLPAITTTSGTATPPAGGGIIDGSLGSNNGNTTAQDRQIPIGPIVGGALGGLALILALILFAYWYIRSQKRAPTTAHHIKVSLGTDEKSSRALSPKPWPLHTYAISPQKAGYQIQSLAESSTSVDPRLSRPLSTTPNASVISSFTELAHNDIARSSTSPQGRPARRERDAEPLSLQPDNDEGDDVEFEVLPPDYRQVFRRPRRNTDRKSVNTLFRSFGNRTRNERTRY
ncbi:hypothetical protein CVT24_006428 [Panaeolus cyanescens]|uniref:Uncharacterized protein n=1 Tax=Panaeolus cyanescens TaxID=181874 RepID=A0A409VZB9_9AGAR|nr:hypothetical protein CVT24_006428 [Panaeolus cyanescens]